MKRRIDLRSSGTLTILIMLCLAAAAVFLTGPIRAALGQDTVEIGVTYTCPEMNNYEFKVISCDAKNWCQVLIVNQFARGGGNVSGEGKSTVASTITKGACTVKGRPAAAEKTVPPNNEEKNGDADTPAPRPANQATSCPSDPGLTTNTKGGSMELKSKRAILARFQQAVDKGEKVAVGITFDSFQIGPPRSNIRGVNYYEDAPVGAKIYPIKSKFTLCSLFSTEITKDVIDGRYECFNDNFGEWSCGTATGYRIIKTTYEKIKK